MTVGLGAPLRKPVFGSDRVRRGTPGAGQRFARIDTSEESRHGGQEQASACAIFLSRMSGSTIIVGRAQHRHRLSTQTISPGCSEAHVGRSRERNVLLVEWQNRKC
jgi:hypothetical protein